LNNKARRDAQMRFYKSMAVPVLTHGSEIWAVTEKQEAKTETIEINYWGIGLFPSSGILGNRKHDVSETGSVSVLRCGGGETPTQLGPLDRAYLNHCFRPLEHWRHGCLCAFSLCLCCSVCR
jgi:hypothetical protein